MPTTDEKPAQFGFTMKAQELRMLRRLAREQSVSAAQLLRQWIREAAKARFVQPSKES